MATIVISCPNCNTQFKIANAEEKEGKKILCKKCNSPFRIHVPASSSEDESDEEMWGASLEQDVAVSTSRPLPPKTLTKKQLERKKAREEAEAKNKPQPRVRERRPVKPSVVIAAVAGSVLFVAMIVGGLYFLKVHGGKLGAAPQKYTPPADEDYVDFRPRTIPLSARIPKNWTTDTHAGVGGKPSVARFADPDGNLKIEVREIPNRGPVGHAVKNMTKGQAGVAVGGPSAQDQLDKEQAEGLSKIYGEYQEFSVRAIEAKFGAGKAADFTGKEGLLRTPIAGCRASISNEALECHVVCQCPLEIFREAKPVFEKIIMSLGDGSQP